MKNVFLGPQNVSPGTGFNFLSVGDEVKYHTGNEQPETGYVVSIASEADRSRTYVLRSAAGEIHTAELEEIESVRSQATGEWVSV